MPKIQTIVVLLVLFIIMLFSMPSCAPEVTQQEYDRVNNELSEAKSQITTIQSKLAEAEKFQGQYEELNKNYETLKKQYDTKMNEIKTIESGYNDLTAKYEDMEKQFNDLTAKYEDLEKKYDVLKEGPAVITEEGVGLAILELINQDRKNNGLNELLWGKNLYVYAERNSRTMAEKAEYRYSEHTSWQEVFWAAGYSTVDSIANGALLVWRSNSYRYEHSILNDRYKYGAVAVYKSGDIFYITYIADMYE